MPVLKRFLCAAGAILILTSVGLAVVTSNGNGLKADYFTNGTLTGSPTLTRTDQTVDFDWGHSGPGGGIPVDHFSARWTGQVEAPVTGAFVFSTISDDGVRLWVNGTMVIDNWTNHGPTRNAAAAVNLTAGQRVDLKMEFFENAGSATAKLRWAYPGQPEEVIPQSHLYSAAVPAPPNTTSYLSDLDPSHAENGFGPYQRDASNGGRGSNDGHQIKLNGVTFVKGLGVHAASDIRYRLSGRYATFKAQIGIDDEVGNNGSAVFQVWVDGVKKFESPVLKGTDAAKPVSVDVSGKQELKLVVLSGGDGSSNDDADWADAKLVFAPTVAGKSFLSDLAWSAESNGWGPPQRDRSNGEAGSNDGHMLTIQGVKFDKGLGVHAPSEIRYNLAGQYQTFHAQVGVDDEVGNRGSVIFQVWVDGVKAFESPILRGADAAKLVSLSVAGKQELKLIVNSAGDGIGYDHADWADAYLLGTGTSGGPAVPAAPTNLKGTAGDKQIVLTWTAVSGASTYNVYRGTSAGGEGFAPMATAITAATYTNTGLTNGTPYFYKVSAVNTTGTGLPSNEATATPVGVIFGAPTNLKATAGQQQVVLTWTSVSGATTYNVYRGTAAGAEGANPIATGIAAATYTNTGLTNGTTYFYKVSAVGSGNPGPPSNEASATPVAVLPAAPTGLQATAAPEKVVLTWTAVQGATSYNVYRGTAAGAENPAPVATGINAATYTNTGLTNGTTYFYKVAAVNTGGTGPSSNEASATPQPLAPGAPSGLKAAVGDQQIVLTWNIVATATSYNVYRGSAAGAEGITPIATGIANATFTNTGLTNGTAYFYKVAAINGGGTSPPSGEATATPVPPIPGAPAGVTATAGDKQVLVTWNSVPGAVSYNVYRGTAAGAESNTAIATGIAVVSFPNTGLANGTMYFYKVSAVNPGGTSAKSAEASAMPTAPGLILSAAQQDAFRFLRQATWGPNSSLVDHVAQVGKGAFIDEQVNSVQSQYPDALITMPNMELVQERFFENAMLGDDQLRQRLAWALSEIFVVSANKVDRTEAMVPYIRMLHGRAFDNMRTILSDVSLSPAMGEMLDMVNNKKADPVTGFSPNENYARELLQLFSIGLVELNDNGTPRLDNTGQQQPTFNQTAIAELARILTGWTYGDAKATNPTNTNPRYYKSNMKPVERFHDTGQKTVFGVVFPAGQTTQQDFDQVLNLIFNHQNVPPFLCRELIQRLVTSNPSQSYLSDIVAVFKNNGQGVRGDMRAVVKAILLHQEAVNGTATSGKFSEPALFVLTLSRALNAKVVDHPFMSDFTQDMSQRIWFAPSVFNYFSPNFRSGALFAPEMQIWTTATAMSRTNFVASLISGGFGSDVTIDYTAFNAVAPDPNALVDTVNALVMGGTMGPQMRQAIITALASARSNQERIRTALYLAAASMQYQVEH